MIEWLLLKQILKYLKGKHKPFWARSTVWVAWFAMAVLLLWSSHFPNKELWLQRQNVLAQMSNFPLLLNEEDWTSFFSLFNSCNSHESFRSIIHYSKNKWLYVKTTLLRKKSPCDVQKTPCWIELYVKIVNTKLQKGNNAVNVVRPANKRWSRLLHIECSNHDKSFCSNVW